MALPPPPEIANRVRAAFAYAGQDVTKEHNELGISKATVARIVSRSDPRGASSEELERVATFTGVPLGFLLDGWASDAPRIDERVEALEHRLTALLDEIAAAREEASTALFEQGQTIVRHTREIAALRAAHRPRVQAEGNVR